MASINATTSSGIVATADNTGTLQLQTAGTNAINIDASQNVGIGTSSPSVPVDILNNVNNVFGQLRLSSSGSFGTRMTFTSTSTNGRTWQIGSNFISGVGEFAIYDYTATAERMRIDSSGNVLVGTTGTFDLGFGAQRFNSRTTNQSAGFFDITDGTNEPILILANATSTGYTNRMVDMRTNMATGTGFTAYSYMSNTNTLRFYVRGDGVIFSTSTTISAISDVRHKENIRELDTGLKEVLALQPRRFDWKENQGTNEKDVPGFIAQEVEKVIPELVEDWRNEGEEETYKALKMGNMIPTLVKAIQEQQEIIKQLQADVAALKGAK